MKSQSGCRIRFSCVAMVASLIMISGCEGGGGSDSGGSSSADYSGTWYFTDPPVYRINGHYFTVSIVDGKAEGTIFFPNPSARNSSGLSGTVTGSAFAWQYRNKGGCAGVIYVTGTFTSPTTAEGQNLTGPNGCPDAGSVMPWKAEKR